MSRLFRQILKSDKLGAQVLITQRRPLLELRRLLRNLKSVIAPLLNTSKKLQSRLVEILVENHEEAKKDSKKQLILKKTYMNHFS